MNEDVGVWFAFNWDSSAVVPFATELEALRYANSLHMQVKFARFGDEDWMTREHPSTFKKGNP